LADQRARCGDACSGPPLPSSSRRALCACAAVSRRNVDLRAPAQLTKCRARASGGFFDVFERDGKDLGAVLERGSVRVHARVRICTRPRTFRPAVVSVRELYLGCICTVAFAGAGDECALACHRGAADPRIRRRTEVFEGSHACLVGGGAWESGSSPRAHRRRRSLRGITRRLRRDGASISHSALWRNGPHLRGSKRVSSPSTSAARRAVFPSLAMSSCPQRAFYPPRAPLATPYCTLLPDVTVHTRPGTYHYPSVCRTYHLPCLPLGPQ
ncbi:hypothetical protein C8R47DRAFT_1248526, partial [Mycena vitilis]